MQALCLMLLPSYYAQNYAGIIGSILPPSFGQTRQSIPWTIVVHGTLSIDHCWQSIQWNKHFPLAILSCRYHGLFIIHFPLDLVYIRYHGLQSMIHFPLAIVDRETIVHGPLFVGPLTLTQFCPFLSVSSTKNKSVYNSRMCYICTYASLYIYIIINMCVLLNIVITYLYVLLHENIVV